jgi:hypothetical protein
VSAWSCKDCGCSDSAPCVSAFGVACSWSSPLQCSFCSGTHVHQPPKLVQLAVTAHKVVGLLEHEATRDALLVLGTALGTIAGEGLERGDAEEVWASLLPPLKGVFFEAFEAARRLASIDGGGPCSG